KAKIERRLAEVHLHRGNFTTAESHFLRAIEACGDFMPGTRTGTLKALARGICVHIWHRLFPARFSAQPGPLNPLHEAHLRSYESYIWLMLFLDQEKLVLAMQKVINLAQQYQITEGGAKAAAGYGGILDMFGLHTLARHYHFQATELAKLAANPAV